MIFEYSRDFVTDIWGCCEEMGTWVAGVSTVECLLRMEYMVFVLFGPNSLVNSVHDPGETNIEYQNDTFWPSRY